MNQNLQPKVRLNNGLLMPQIGLGVWKTPLETTRQMVCDALANDYVLLDTAKQYGNESAVGQGMQDAFQSTGRTRASVFLTTKIYNGDQGDYDRVRKGFEGQLQALQTDYNALAGQRLIQPDLAGNGTNLCRWSGQGNRCLQFRC